MLHPEASTGAPQSGTFFCVEGLKISSRISVGGVARVAVVVRFDKTHSEEMEDYQKMRPLY